VCPRFGATRICKESGPWSSPRLNATRAARNSGHQRPAFPLTEFSEFPGGQHGQGAERTRCIVIALPGSQAFLGLSERFGDVRVQALRAQPRVERVDVRAVRRLSGTTEVEPHILAIASRIQGVRGEPRLVVHLDHGRLPMRLRQSVEHLDHVARGERSACLGRQRSSLRVGATCGPRVTTDFLRRRDFDSDSCLPGDTGAPSTCG
jgi:hypothetical protein